jgi:hypothetical protein
MQIVTRTSKKIAAEMEKDLPAVFFEKTIRDHVEELQRLHSFSDSTKYRLIHSAKPVDMNWNGRSKGKLYSFKKDEVTEMDVLQFWTQLPRHYLSYFSALYFNNLVEQKPTHHFISHEILSKGNVANSGLLNDFNVRQAFLKPARATSSFFEFKNDKFFLIEKKNLEGIGVETKRFKFEVKTYEFKITSLERTFLDCIISPQYSGGLSTVISVFIKKELNLNHLIEIYKRINPIYPYWQTVGFLLQKFGQLESEKLWIKEFKEFKKIPFYLDHEAKPSWIFSKDWQIHYPSGVFSEANN